MFYWIMYAFLEDRRPNFGKNVLQTHFHPAFAFSQSIMENQNNGKSEQCVKSLQSLH